MKLRQRHHCLPAGDAFLVVSGSSQPKVYDRDGHELGEFPKGDMYIRDATNTKGHQYRCCGGQWHPEERCIPQTSGGLVICYIPSHSFAAPVRVHYSYASAA